MTFDELTRKILDILPGAQFTEDNLGQIIIYTDMEQNKDGLVVSFGCSPKDMDEHYKSLGR